MGGIPGTHLICSVLLYSMRVPASRILSAVLSSRTDLQFTILRLHLLQIKVYDEVKKMKISNLGGEELYPPGHNSRVYCVKFNPQEPNVLYSGGWDMRIVRWDLRQGKPDSMGNEKKGGAGEDESREKL